MGKLVIRRKYLRSLGACAEGIEEFTAFVRGKSLTIESKTQAEQFASRFVFGDAGEDRVGWLEWLFDEIAPAKASTKATKRTYRIMYGKDEVVWETPAKKKLRRAARHYGKKLWQYRARAMKLFKEAL